MEVLMVGAGSAFSKKYGNTSALVTTSSGYKLLIDCGFTTPTDLEKHGISLNDIDGIFVSHLHADHVGGIEEVAFKNRYLHGGRKMDLLVPEGLVKKLWKNCLKGGLQHTAEGECTLDDYFNVFTMTETDPVPAELRESLRIYRTEHVPNKLSFAIGIEDMLFTCDTVFNADWIYNLSRHKAIFHDCQLFTGGVHASLEELLTLPEELQEKMYLMHYGDNVDEFLGKSGLMEFAVPGVTYKI